MIKILWTKNQNCSGRARVGEGYAEVNVAGDLCAIGAQKKRGERKRRQNARKRKSAATLKRRKAQALAEQEETHRSRHILGLLPLS